MSPNDKEELTNSVFFFLFFFSLSFLSLFLLSFSLLYIDVHTSLILCMLSVFPITLGNGKKKETRKKIKPEKREHPFSKPSLSLTLFLTRSRSHVNGKHHVGRFRRLWFRRRRRKEGGRVAKVKAETKSFATTRRPLCKVSATKDAGSAKGTGIPRCAKIRTRSTVRTR